MAGDGKLRAAMIGCGYFSQFHVAAWKRMGGVEIVAACDPRIEKAKRISGRAFVNGCLGYEQVEAVPMVSPPFPSKQLIGGEDDVGPWSGGQVANDGCLEVDG